MIGTKMFIRKLDIDSGSVQAKGEEDVDDEENDYVEKDDVDVNEEDEVNDEHCSSLTPHLFIE